MVSKAGLLTNEFSRGNSKKCISCRIEELVRSDPHAHFILFELKSQASASVSIPCDRNKSFRGLIFFVSTHFKNKEKNSVATALSTNLHIFGSSILVATSAFWYIYGNIFYLRGRLKLLMCVLAQLEISWSIYQLVYSSFLRQGTPWYNIGSKHNTRWSPNFEVISKQFNVVAIVSWSWIVINQIILTIYTTSWRNLKKA